MKKLQDGYTIVKELLEEKRFFISENELKEYEDGNIALAILKSKYNAKYREPYDTHFSGVYYFDNPLIPKKDYYELDYCYFDSNEWESCAMQVCDDNPTICREIIRLDIDDEDLYWNKSRREERIATERDLFDYIINKKVYVGKDRYWRIKMIKDY